MKNPLALITAICLAGFATSASAQIYKIHNADVAVGATGQFTTSITSQPNTLPHQETTNSAGFLLTFRDHPLPWAGVELNYQYSSFSERFTNIAGRSLANVPLSFHEATAAYLIHPHFSRFQPSIGIGGGDVYFNPSPEHRTTQLRATGLFEIGFDLPTRNRHLGFRVQGRTLLYRAPNFNNPALSSSRWVATSEPSASVYVRF